MIALYEELGSYRAVGSIVGCDHKTVKRYVELAGEQGHLAPTCRRARLTDPHLELIAARVEKKKAEGKSRMEALRCLKRHLARVVWQALRSVSSPAPSALLDSRNLRPAVALVLT